MQDRAHELGFIAIGTCSRTSQEGRIECARHRAPRKIVRDKGDVSALTHTNTCVIDKHFVQVDCRETSRFLPSPSSASDAAQLEWDGTAWSLSLPWPAADQRDRESVLVELVTCSASVRHGWLDFPQAIVVDHHLNCHTRANRRRSGKTLWCDCCLRSIGQ